MGHPFSIKRGASLLATLHSCMACLGWLDGWEGAQGAYPASKPPELLGLMKERSPRTCLQLQGGCVWPPAHCPDSHGDACILNQKVAVPETETFPRDEMC